MKLKQIIALDRFNYAHQYLSMFKIDSTSDLSTDVLKEQFFDLGETVEIRVSDRQMSFKSMDAPSWVNIVVQLDYWIALSAGVGLFLASFLTATGKKFGEKSAESIIKKLAETIVKIKNESNANTTIKVSFPLPSERLDTSFIIEAATKPEIQIQLSIFLSLMPALKKFFEDNNIENRDLASPIFLNLKNDGSMVVEWMEHPDLKKIKHIIKTTNH